MTELARKMNILYIGSSGALSLLPFKQLLTSEYSIAAVGIFRPIHFSEKIIALENESLALSAQQQGIPLIDLSQPVKKLVQRCSELALDVILMSCYGERLPDELTKLAEKGCFNMHPSLLPQFRGAEPIFWQIKQGSDVGVSWHKVIQEFDAGDIVSQQKVLVDEGASYAEISQALAHTGAMLMQHLLSDITTGRLVGQPQNKSEASYYSYPGTEDFVVDTAFSAQQAYNFMRATHAFGQAYLCQTGGHRYLLDKALDYDNNASLEQAEVQANRLYIPCNEGVLIATFTGKL